MTGKILKKCKDRLKTVTREEVYRELYHGCTGSFIGTTVEKDGVVTNFLPIPADDHRHRAFLTKLLNACSHIDEYTHFKVNPFKKNIFTTTRNEAFTGRGHIECAHYISSYMHRGKPLYMQLTNIFLRYLTGMMVDLDVGRPDKGIRLTAEEAVFKVFQLVDENELPCPQFIAFSGRGANMLYLIRNPENGKPYEYSSKMEVKWKAVSKVMEDKLEREGLHPDHMMINPGQSFKAPDSLHPKTGKKIQYYRVIGSDNFIDLEGEAVVSSNEDKLLEDKEEKSSPAEPDWQKKELMHEAAKGFGFIKSRNGNRDATARGALAIANDLELIAESRGGFPEGYRSRAVFHYFHSWYNSFMITKDGDYKKSRVAARRKALAFNKRYCTPPLLKGDYPKLEACTIKVRSETLIKIFEVTEQEMKSLKLKTISYERIKLTQRGEERKRKSEEIEEEKKRKQEEVIRLFKEGYSKKDIERLTAYSYRHILRILKDAPSPSI